MEEKRIITTDIKFVGLKIVLRNIGLWTSTLKRMSEWSVFNRMAVNRTVQSSAKLNGYTATYGRLTRGTEIGCTLAALPHGADKSPLTFNLVYPDRLNLLQTLQI